MTVTEPITDSPAEQDALAASPEVENLPALLSRGTDVATTLDERIRVAEVLSEAGMLPEQYRGKRGNVLAAQFAADALNIPLFTAFQHLHIVKGKVGMSAELMRAMMNRAGIRYTIDSNEDRAIMVLVLPGRSGQSQPTPPVTFSIDHAITAGLCRRDPATKKIISRSQSNEVKPWEAHTESMLVARATSKAARMYCPEVLQGMSYTEDELHEAARLDAAPTVVQVSTSSPAATGDAAASAAARIELPESSGDMLTAIAQATTVDQVRDLFRHASRNQWLNEQFGPLTGRGHLVNAQAALNKKSPFAKPGQCDSTDGHTLHAWIDDKGTVLMCIGAPVEILDAELVDGDYPDPEVPEDNFPGEQA